MRPETLLLDGRKRSKRIGGVERKGLLLGKRNCGVARIDAVAGIFDLGDGGLVPGVDDLDSADFFIGLASLFQQLSLAGEHLVFVHVPQRTNHFIFGASGISGSLEIHDVATGEFRGRRSLQTARYEVSVRQDLFADEP